MDAEITPEPSPEERRALARIAESLLAAPRRRPLIAAAGARRESAKTRRPMTATRRPRGPAAVPAPRARNRARRPRSGRARRAGPTTRRPCSTRRPLRSRRSPAAIACDQVFSLPRSRACDHDAALERGQAQARDEELARDDRRHHPAGEDVLADRARSGPVSTRILSATGSSSEPSGEVRPWLRATRPSNQSVDIATMKIPVAQYVVSRARSTRRGRRRSAPPPTRTTRQLIWQGS